MEDLFFGVMELKEAKGHELRLKALGVQLHLKMNDQTCTTGCKVTVEVWGNEIDKEVLLKHFQADYLKHVKGHEPNFANLSQVFDPTAAEVICQACGMKFGPTSSECPDCGLVY